MTSKRLGKRLTAYRDHLVHSFKDGFPHGTAYQRNECRGFGVDFKRANGYTKVFVTVLEWTKHGRVPRTFLHSLVADKLDGVVRGTIMKPKTKISKGSINTAHGFKTIVWSGV